MLGEDRLEGYLGMGVALQEHRLVYNFYQVCRFQHRRRHSREGREFVYHAADIAYMANDRICADRKSFWILLDLLEVSAPQPLCRQLDRGQGVFDLVGDAAGDICPRRLALGRDQFGDVVEGYDESTDIAAVMFGGDSHQQR